MDEVNGMLLKGKTAVVTGCNRGIGKAILERMAVNGADVFAVVRRETAEFAEYCAALSEKHGVEIQIVCADFQDEDQVKGAAKQILKTKRPMDILVNNVGFSYPFKMLAMTTMGEIKNTFQINFFSPLLFTQLISKNMMKNKKGNITFISSTAVYDGGSDTEYTASKAAIVGAVRRLAIELGVFGIRVNTVAPSLTDTDMGHNRSEEDTVEVLNRNIMKRMGQPEEVADAVIFMSSDMSRFITGQVLRVDGGLL